MRSPPEACTQPCTRKAQSVPPHCDTIPSTENQKLNAADFILGAEVSPHRTAIITGQAAHTYLELRNAVGTARASLAKACVQPGERVVIIGDNSFFWAAAYLATLAHGAVAVPLAPATSAETLASILDSTSPAAAFLQDRIAPKVCPLFGSKAAIFLEGDFQAEHAADTPSYQPLNDARELAALMFTSGSTGDPRGVMVSHRNLIANTQSIVRYLELSEQDRIMCVLPFYYCFGTSLLHTHLRAGGTLVIDNRIALPDRVLARMQETACTGFAGVPATYQLLLRSSRFKEMRFPHLRKLQQAGGKLHDHLIQELREAAPGTRLYIMYGQTEATARLSYLPPELLDRKLGSIGRGIPGVKLTVVDEHGRPAPPGQAGEIVAEGENIALGYWQDEAETAATFRDGRLYTGDIGRADEDGFLYVVDRAKSFIKPGGFRVSCHQIESAILRFPGMREAAVIGAPHELLGEAVHLFASHPDGESARERLMAFCADALPPYQRPVWITFIEELPKNSSGKPDRMLLKRNALEAAPRG